MGTNAFSGCTNLFITWSYNSSLTAANFNAYLTEVIIPANASEQSIELTLENSAYTLGGDISKTNAGEYSATVALNKANVRFKAKI